MTSLSPFHLPEYPRRFERFAFTAAELLPGSTWERTRDIIQLFYGEQSGITVVVTPEAVEVRIPTIEWSGGEYGPVESSRLYRRLLLRQLPEPVSVECKALLSDCFQAALKKRQSEFKKCRYCGETVPPEHRFSRDVCHGCASRHIGVVY